MAKTPYPIRCVSARRHDILAVRAKLRGIHPIAVPRQCLHALPRRRAPYSHRLVLARRHDTLAVRAKLRGSHPIAVPRQCLHALPWW